MGSTDTAILLWEGRPRNPRNSVAAAVPNTFNLTDKLVIVTGCDVPSPASPQRVSRGRLHPNASWIMTGDQVPPKTSNMVSVGRRCVPVMTPIAPSTTDPETTTQTAQRSVMVATGSAMRTGNIAVSQGDRLLGVITIWRNGFERYLHPAECRVADSPLIQTFCGSRSGIPSGSK
jgi:hypothetical protein